MSPCDRFFDSRIVRSRSPIISILESPPTRCRCYHYTCYAAARCFPGHGIQQRIPLSRSRVLGLRTSLISNINDSLAQLPPLIIWLLEFAPQKSRISRRSSEPPPEYSMHSPSWMTFQLERPGEPERKGHPSSFHGGGRPVGLNLRGIVSRIEVWGIQSIDTLTLVHKRNAMFIVI